MSQQQSEVSVKARTPGKHFSRQSRVEGWIPAVVYGPKNKPVNCLTHIIALRKLMSKRIESTIFKLKSEDGSLNGISVLFRDIQVHPVTRVPVHIDFYAVDMASSLRVNVEIKLTGKPIGLTEGGLLEQTLRELVVECRPDAIPEAIIVDVSELHVGEAIHVSDLKVPENVKIISLPNLTVATCAYMKEEEVVAAPVAAVEGAAAAPGAAAAAGAAPGSAPGAAPAAPGAAAAKPAAAKPDAKKK